MYVCVYIYIHTRIFGRASRGLNSSTSLFILLRRLSVAFITLHFVSYRCQYIPLTSMLSSLHLPAFPTSPSFPSICLHHPSTLSIRVFITFHTYTCFWSAFICPPPVSSFSSSFVPHLLSFVFFFHVLYIKTQNCSILLKSASRDTAATLWGSTVANDSCPLRMTMASEKRRLR